MTGASFPPEARLQQSIEFRAVLNNGRRYIRSGLVVVVDRGDSPEARLGLALAKRRIPRAVDRNRVKRVIRESFRCARSRLGSVDIVVLARNGTARMPDRRLSGQLHSIWQELASESPRHGQQSGAE